MEIIINATATKIGGALSILKMMISDASKDKNNKYYFFVSIPLENMNYDNIEIITIKERNLFSRIKWDLLLLKKECKKRRIEPNVAISLQNTGFRINKKTKKMIYIHQSLPFEKEVQIPFSQKKLWFYKNIYGILMRLTIRKEDILIVQTNSMKQKVKNQFKKNNIYIIPPKFKIHVIESKVKKPTNKFYLFFPGLYQSYKNHIIILKAIKKLKDINNDIKISFICNLDKTNITEWDYVKENHLENYVDFIGKVDYEKILKIYSYTNLLVFPSYVETFGLPLIEAANYEIPILVSNLDYAKDVLNGYNNVTYIDYNDVDMWASEIKKAYNTKSVKTDVTLPTILKDYESIIELLNTILENKL